MSDSADIAARTQRFNDTARAFTPPSPARHAKLMPLKEGIVELRQKGASLRLIRELLATVDVAVGTDTIARFLAEVTGETAPQRSLRRPVRKPIASAKLNGRQPAAAPAISDQSAASALQHTDPPPERPRTRGPRVADPRNL